MREFKFRCWDKHLKYWVNTEDMPILQQDDKEPIYEFGGDGLGFIFCQYTGLQDKTGKDIYEGDILKDGDVLLLVGFEGGAFGTTDNPHGMFEAFCNSFTGGEKIIGNIYENPELLND